MSVTINGESYGILTTGFRRPSKAQILAQLRIDALDGSQGFGPNADLGASSPLGRFLAVIAERLDVLWQAQEALYYAAYIPTATGAALALKTAEMGITRRAATYATGIVTFYGEKGNVIPLGTQVQATSGTLFQTLDAAELPARGRIDVRVEAEEAGVTGNVAVNTITTIVNPISGVDSVINEYDPGTTLLLGQNVQGSIALAADGLKNDYQLVLAADILHPHTIEDIAVTVANEAEPTPHTAMFNVHLEFIDHFNGELLGRTETQTFELTAGEQISLQFTDEGIDIHAATSEYVRVLVVNEESSEAVLGLCYDAANQYQHGSLYLNTVEQTGYDAIMSITSRLPGATSGGDDGETDPDLRLRYRLTRATAGSATAEAVSSQLYRVTGVKSVYIRQNRMDYVVDGMNPHSVEATVYGGDPDDVGAALLASVPAGCETLGSSAVTVLDAINQAHVMCYNKAARTSIYVAVTLTVDGSFSYDAGVETIQDALINYIGGEDSSGQFHIGLLPAADVIYQKLVALIMAIDGVVDVQVKAGKTANPTGTSNIAIAATEVAETKVDYLAVTVS